MAMLNGTNNADWLIGTSGADVIKGYGGNDTLKGGGGADRLDGGTGIDSVLYADSTTAVVVDLATGTGRYGTADGDTLISIENVHGSAYGDLLSGNISPNSLYGLDGNDWLDGRGGADLLDGGYGDDTLQGGGSADTLNGGEGADTAWYLDSPAGVLVSLIDDRTSSGYAEGDDLNSIENVVGSNFSDVLLGDDGANALEGYEGHDTLKGFGGADRLYGYDGDDSLVGMDGNDQLVGDTGRDVLNGGRGADHMYGGPDADVFLWSSIDDLGLTVATTDWVLDMYAEEGDRLDLSGIDANVYTPGDQAFTFIGMAPFSGRPGEIRYYQAGDETFLQLQTGTSTDIEGLIRLGPVLSTPDASWFFL
jgi:Ca2+-binding RTX toxin-like protein